MNARRITVAGTLVAAGALAAAGATALARSRKPPVARARIVDPADPTTIAAGGAVRSVQAADITLPRVELERLWSASNLERLARTYWRFLTRISLGAIRVLYSSTERAVVLFGRPFVLLRFHAPEYELSGQRGLVRWRIKDGVLVARRGRGQGYLQIEVERRAAADSEVVVHVEVEVANFYPSIASRLGTWLYQVTQSRIHVLVTHGFLRSLVRLDLAESRVGHYREPVPPAALDQP